MPRTANVSFVATRTCGFRTPESVQSSELSTTTQGNVMSNRFRRAAQNNIRSLFVAITLSAGVPTFAEPVLPAVDAVMRPFVERGDISGAVMLAIKDGKRVHAGLMGWRDIASKTPMTADTIFRAFSMTKPVTGVAMMILRDEGHWRPEDPVTKFIPEFAQLRVFAGRDKDGQLFTEPMKRSPTMGELMTHTAGFGYGITPGDVEDLYRAAGLQEATSGDDYIARVAKIPLSYQPGTRWQYSISMDLQGAIIERISGQKLDAFLQARIFAPLNMKDSGFSVPEKKRARFASFYQWKDAALQPVQQGMFASSYASPPAFVSGGGGMVTTADDYARFAQMLLNLGAHGDVRIMSAAAADEMMSNHLSDELTAGGYRIGQHFLRPGFQHGYNGVVITDPKAAGVWLGKGSYLWDGVGGTWFWVDPQNKVVFVGMVQRVFGPGFPPLQQLSQWAVAYDLHLKIDR